MIIGVISDVHNNLVALENVLIEFQKKGCEIIICAGDIIGIGPSPEATVSRLSVYSNTLYAVQGNHEHYLTVGMKNSKMSEHEYLYHKWEHNRLSQESIRFLSDLPNELLLSIEGKRIYIEHYAKSKGKFIRPVQNPNNQSIKKVFGEIDADIIIYGHNHTPSLIEDKITYINPGSLGCPGRDENIARAGILDIGKDIKYEQLEISYNVDLVLNKIEEHDYPAKEEIKKFFFGINR